MNGQLKSSQSSTGQLKSSKFRPLSYSEHPNSEPSQPSSGTPGQLKPLGSSDPRAIQTPPTQTIPTQTPQLRPPQFRLLPIQTLPTQTLAIQTSSQFGPLLVQNYLCMCMSLKTPTTVVHGTYN